MGSAIRVSVFGLALTACVLRSGSTTGDNAPSGNVTGATINVLKTDQFTYSVRVVNPNPVRSWVWIDNTVVGWLNPRAFAFMRLPAGEYTVTLIDEYRNPLSQYNVRAGKEGGGE
jgi:hypothetical protein